MKQQAIICTNIDKLKDIIQTHLAKCVTIQISFTRLVSFSMTDIKYLGWYYYHMSDKHSQPGEVFVNL